jgi:hypothetical protein
LSSTRLALELPQAPLELTNLLDGSVGAESLLLGAFLRERERPAIEVYDAHEGAVEAAVARAPEPELQAARSDREIAARVGNEGLVVSPRSIETEQSFRSAFCAP